MKRLSRQRIVALLGIGWFVCLMVGAGVLQGEPPAASDSAASLREYFADVGTRYLVGDFVAGIGFALFLLPFASLLPGALGLSGHDTAAWRRLASSSMGALIAIGGTATSFLDGVAISQGVTRLDDSTLLALTYANAAGIALIGLPTATFAVAASVMVLRSALHNLIGYVGLLSAALLVAGAAFPLQGAEHGLLWNVRFASFVVFAAFIIAASVALLLGRSPIPVHAPTNPTPTRTGHS